MLCCRRLLCTNWKLLDKSNFTYALVSNEAFQSSTFSNIDILRKEQVEQVNSTAVSTNKIHSVPNFSMAIPLKKGVPGYLASIVPFAGVAGRECFTVLTMSAPRSRTHRISWKVIRTSVWHQTEDRHVRFRK
jgi:hypothetical protein